MNPVIPFEPVSTDKFPEGPMWVAQVKWDGVRMLTYLDGHEFRLFNRKRNERTWHYPELHDPADYCTAKSVILDGEIIALRNGRPSFHEVMKRDGIRRRENVPGVRARVPVIYMVFDVLFADGKWVTNEPLSNRQTLLRELVVPQPYIQLVDNFEDPQSLYEVVQSRDMEGVVVKDLTSAYVMDGKDARWRKRKFYKDLIAVVGGVTHRDNVVNALVLGVYDEAGALQYIGHAGTGKLSSEDWLALTTGIRPLVRSSMPFANRPSRMHAVTWLEPALTVKVRFMEWSSNGTLRQPTIQAFVSVPPAECRFE